MYVANEEPEELKNSDKGQKPLRIDHSKVHFDNGRLAEKLNTDLNEISANQHRQWMSRTSEIKDIRQTLEDYKTILKNQKRDRNRPHTSSSYLSRRKRTPSPVMTTIQSKVTPPNLRINNEIIDSDSDDGTYLDDDPFRNPRMKSAPGRQQRNSVISINSTSSRRSVASGPNVFLSQLNSRGTGSKMLVVRQHNGKRSESQFSRRTISSYSSRNGRLSTPAWQDEVDYESQFNDAEEQQRIQLLCGSNKTLSRRQLKQLTNVDRFVDDERKKRSSRYQEALRKNVQERLLLDQRVKDFIKTLMDKRLQLNKSTGYTRHQVSFT